MHPFERGIIRRHAVILQSGEWFHAALLFLGEHFGYFFCSVVAVIEEYHGIAGLDCSVYCLVDYWFDEFVRDTGLIAFFDSLGHIGGFTAFAVYEHIVGHEDAVPVVVSVHGVVTAYY